VRDAPGGGLQAGSRVVGHPRQRVGAVIPLHATLAVPGAPTMLASLAGYARCAFGNSGATVSIECASNVSNLSPVPKLLSARMLITPVCRETNCRHWAKVAPPIDSCGHARRLRWSLVLLVDRRPRQHYPGRITHYRYHSNQPVCVGQGRGLTPDCDSRSPDWLGGSVACGRVKMTRWRTEVLVVDHAVAALRIVVRGARARRPRSMSTAAAHCRGNGLPVLAPVHDFLEKMSVALGDAAGVACHVLVHEPFGGVGVA
jgi:hypothetical protein